jgi:predicted nuclease of restriction endonuclease-like (RecB) superfamily
MFFDWQPAAVKTINLSPRLLPTAWDDAFLRLARTEIRAFTRVCQNRCGNTGIPTTCRVFATTNQALIELYWRIGKYISERLAASEWGQKTIEQLADFIQTCEPGIKGFEKRNLERMRQFYETYPDEQITTALRTQLSWTHHRIIMSRCKSEAERLFYLRLTAQERYSTRELDRQINSGIFERTRIAEVKLPQRSHPAPLSGVFRDSYSNRQICYDNPIIRRCRGQWH